MKKFLYPLFAVFLFMASCSSESNDADNTNNNETGYTYRFGEFGSDKHNYAIICTPKNTQYNDYVRIHIAVDNMGYFFSKILDKDSGKIITTCDDFLIFTGYNNNGSITYKSKPFNSLKELENSIKNANGFQYILENNNVSKSNYTIEIFFDYDIYYNDKFLPEYNYTSIIY